MSRAAWEKHPNGRGPAGTLLAIHDQFRAASKRLCALVEDDTIDPKWLARAFMPLGQTLHHHHHAEEIMLFPLVLERTGVEPAQLVDDHETLKNAIEAVSASVTKSTIAAFDAILIEHLDREEALVIPVLLQLTPEEAWSVLR